MLFAKPFNGEYITQRIWAMMRKQLNVLFQYPLNPIQIWDSQYQMIFCVI